MAAVSGFDVVAEGDMPASLDQAVRDLLCTCFPVDAAIFSTTRYWHGSEPAYSVIHRCAGEVDGNLAIVVRDIRVGMQTVRIAGVQNMAVRPGTRGSGIGAELMDRAMTEARRRGVPFGLLFCVPELAKYYGRFDWRPRDVIVRMDFLGKVNIPIPGKNICMTLNLTEVQFPSGDMHVGGADW